MARSDRKKKKKDDFEDDGRTIANMNIEGMPWFTGMRDVGKLPSDKNSRASGLPAGNEEREKKTDGAGDMPAIGAKETRALLRGVLLATLLIGAVFLVVLAGFILFCIYVWFR